jgi:predicted nucleotidyltransferase
MNSQRAGVFTVDERNRMRDRILELANSDERIVAGAVVGSLATGEGDRWSDLDLTFGVDPEDQIIDVLNRLTKPLVTEFGAVHLFDLPHRASIFRVLLLQGCLQVDLSVTPASKFGPNGPNFRMLFGSYTENPPIPAPRAGELIGYAAHHAARARFCIERSFLAGGILDKRCTRLHSQPCLPPARSVSPLRQGL